MPQIVNPCNLFLPLLPIHVIHDTAVIVSYKKRVFPEAEDVGGAAVDLAQFEEACDEIC